jgi:hypothetical protein
MQFYPKVDYLVDLRSRTLIVRRHVIRKGACWDSSTKHIFCDGVRIGFESFELVADGLHEENVVVLIARFWEPRGLVRSTVGHWISIN